MIFFFIDLDMSFTVFCSSTFERRKGKILSKEKKLVLGNIIHTPTKHPFSHYYETDENMVITQDLYNKYNQYILNSNEQKMCIPIKNNTIGKYLKTELKPCNFNLEPCVCYSKKINKKFLNKIKNIDINNLVQKKRNKMIKEYIFILWKFK